jgi:hypothetical protein
LRLLKQDLLRAFAKKVKGYQSSWWNTGTGALSVYTIDGKTLSYRVKDIVEGFEAKLGQKVTWLVQ